MLPFALDAVIFDVGGTLVHLDYDFVAAAAVERGVSLTSLALQKAEVAARQALDAQVRARGSHLGTDAGRLRGYFGAMLRAAGVPESDQHAILDAIEREHGERNLWRRAFGSAGSTLAGLRSRGLRTAVVSNSDGRVARVLAELDLARHLDLILDSHLEGVEKPDPEIFRRALRRLGIAPERAVYVGDIYSIDAMGARAAGIAPLIVDPTGSYRGLDCPVIADLGELLLHLGGTERSEGAQGGEGT